MPKRFVSVVCLAVCLSLVSTSFAEEPTPEINHLHILYLLQSQEPYKAIDLYGDYRQALGRHDFELLQQMALLLLEKGARSKDTEEQLTSLYGSAIGGIATAIDILEAGILSPHSETQMAAIQYLGNLQDDRSEELLTKAMSSSFLMTRLQAAYQLALRKANNAVGQIESLMHKLPPELRFFFPQFFALVGTKDAIALLRHMMDDHFYRTRIEAILNAARFGRDDLLPLIRARATHLNSAEQEACASALGQMKDLKSLPLLRSLSRSSMDNVALSAQRSLFFMGDEGVREGLIAKAKEGDLFAINCLGEIAGANDALLSLSKSADLQIRCNAAWALLQQGDPRAVPAVLEFLLRDVRDFGFQPLYSSGNSLLAWKVVPSMQQHQKQDAFYDLIAIALHVREAMLRDCLELSEEAFLEVARAVFDARQAELIPFLVHLMESRRTPGVIALLRQKAQTAGAPLIRAYCHLALFRMKEGSEESRKAVLQWIQLKKNTEIVRFRPAVSWAVQLGDGVHGRDLTPEENSRLLIEAYQTIALEHEEKSIDILLEGLRDGHPSNRPVLAGLLIQAIQ